VEEEVELHGEWENTCVSLPSPLATVVGRRDRERIGGETQRGLGLAAAEESRGEEGGGGGVRGLGRVFTRSPFIRTR
jgi:hypothetical protein